MEDLNLTVLALSDATRRAILGRLALGEARVTDLAKPVAISLNAVSKHIQILERAHLVRRRREGREHRHSLNPVPLGEVAMWLEEDRRFWEESFDRLEEYLKEIQSKEGKEGNGTES